jgi:hypothetical protein
LGSFGYEKKHFKVSMQVSELVLLQAVRSAPADTSSLRRSRAAGIKLKMAPAVSRSIRQKFLRDALVGFGWFVAALNPKLNVFPEVKAASPVA